ncbi:MAG TPA: hypothetical protein VE197_01650, partial [Mycobacterium sp.]|nr:hypothetical protein [Mycobacterium sp.]
VVAWGNNEYGQLNVPTGLSGVTAIAVGGYHSLALKGDGTVVAWGLNNYGQTDVPTGLSGVTAISAGSSYALALKADGTVVAWGTILQWPDYGLPSVPAGLADVTAISAGSAHCLALKSEEDVTAPPDLAVVQVADQERISTGDPVGFTVTVTNDGDGTANGVTLTDSLPAYAELSWSVGGTDGAACTMAAAEVSCSFGDMPPGAVKTIRLTSPTQYLGGKGFCPIISSTATVAASNQPEASNATASTEVLCPLVFLEVWSDTPSVTAGDPIRFIITTSNLGDGIARGVASVAVLPNNLGLSWSIANVTPASVAGNCTIDTGGMYPELWCLFDELASGQEVAVTVTSPTTSDSCETLTLSADVTCSTDRGTKGIGASIVVN